MKTRVLPPSPAGILLAAALFSAAHDGAHASDHADPIELKPMIFRGATPGPQETGITDLHVYLDSDQDPALNGQANAVIISFCVHRSLAPLAPAAAGMKTIPSYPPDPPSTLALPSMPRALDLEPYTYRLFIDTDSELSFDDRADRERYGGTVLNPGGIAPEITIEVTLDNDVTIKNCTLSGLINRREADLRVNAPFVPGAINARSGIFDDPFIFPRFFRTNVVGIVISIPLQHFDERRRNWLIWGSTWKGTRQIDHVGRSQRTQVPRFDHLNKLPPSEHVAAINRVHENPTIVEDLQRTLASPLFARRVFDNAPDVMVYRRDQPTLFPNGRKLVDDVAFLIGMTGDTQLFEISYAESAQYPRATTNDGTIENGRVLDLKKFKSTFPYLADPWTVQEARDHPVPRPGRAQLTAATANKLRGVLLGALGTLLGLIGLAYWLGYRTGKFRHHPNVAEGFSAPQGAGNEDHDTQGTSFAELHDAVLDPATSRPYYNVWGAEGEKPLPRYEVSFWTVARGILPAGLPFGLKQATRRTLTSRASLRWGRDRTGFQRLIHPNGVCLAGRWIIEGIDDGTGQPKPTGYSGYFQEGKEGLIVARYSPSRAETRRGGWRSMGMAGKIFPTTDPDDRTPLQPAHFFAQEDLGGTRSMSINQSVLISAPDVHAWRRGKGVFSLLLTGLIFARVNVNATIRQLHEIAELRHPNDPPVAPTRCPSFMRLKYEGSRETPGVDLDVREEILDHIYDRGVAAPQRQLVFVIEVSNHDQDAATLHVTDALIRRDIPESSWTRIGRIVFTEARCGYNGDFVIHFAHPRWRQNRNRPDTTAEVS